jgi:osmotically-inducible protein OsmY
MRRFLLLVVVVGLLAVAFMYFRRPGHVGVPEVPAALGEVKEKLDDVGEKLKETKTAGSVKAALELNRTLEPYSFDVDGGPSGVVTLKGEVGTEEHKALAGQVAGAVPGVERVDNQLRVNPGAVKAAGNERTLGENFDDKALDAKVHLAFSLRKELAGTDIKVSAFKRTVTLSGQVGTPAQKQLAVAIARDTSGVESVVDQIATGASAPAAAPGGDLAGRARAAEAAVRANASLAPYALSVTADGDHLTLRGSVRTTAEKDLAALVARDAGGGPVENLLEIRS